MKPIHHPIIQSTIYEYDTNTEMRDTMLSGEPYFYMRSGNPTVESVARELASLEGSESSLMFASGMAAITCSLLAMLRSGDHVLFHREVFSQTRAFMETVLSKYGVETSFIDTNDLQALIGGIRANTKGVYVEVPSNPALDVVDISAVASVVRGRGLWLFVDSTLATPVLLNPLALGATLVLHSATKYLAGHSDVLCGAICGSKEVVSAIHRVQKLTGGILDPNAAFLVSRGLKTLELRMRQICTNALHLAEFLSQRPEVSQVRYPYLPSHPGFQIARAQMRGGGGVLSFELRKDLPAAREFVDALKLIKRATSLGGIHSTVEIPYDLKRIRDSQEEGMGLIRLSVGIEEERLLRADLEQALQAPAK